MRTSKINGYAIKRLKLLIQSEMNEVQQVFCDESGRIYIEFTSGMNLQIHNDEVEYQANIYLESEIESINHLNK